MTTWMVAGLKYQPLIIPGEEKEAPIPTVTVATPWAGDPHAELGLLEVVDDWVVREVVA
jgi:hypothetical protein